ncbi:YihY/virulence factor BrkB family protein [Novosphingobium sp. PS1R-30]|uniref:YihY/virulence factor BrkB family protein n=1 Tax=Novosphingobium anseongense TaxID=3133436 RepID=A0ABU8RVI4_9SPHN
MGEVPIEATVERNDQSPEARRRRAQVERDKLQARFDRNLGPASRFFTVVKRVLVGAWSDGFIHAGNLAYTAILALFPFFIVIAAVFTALGESGQREASIRAFLSAAPPVVARAIEPVALSVSEARSGWLLWVGGFVGLWTVSSLIETIRDILRRAYGTRPTAAFWRYRLFSTGFIVIAVILLLLSLFAQVAITAAQEVIAAWFPLLDAWTLTLTTSRLIPAAMLYLSIYVLFLSLTPSAYRNRRYPKWPGAMLVTAWWVAITVLLPGVLRNLFSYDLTYGSLAGVMIALFFFWLVGLGMVMGAELNAALAETPEERDAIGQTDDRARTTLKESRTIEE